jgi:hypothetical protein
MSSDDAPLGLLIARRAAAASFAAPPPPAPSAAAPLAGGGGARRAAPFAAPAASRARPFDEPPPPPPPPPPPAWEGEDDDPEAEAGGGAAAPRKRCKKAPAELPSNRGVPRFRRVVDAPAAAPRRDPRFDASSGDFSEAQFHRSYAFLDEHRAAELAALRREAAREKDPARARELQAGAARLSQALAEAAQRRKLEEAKKGATGASAEAVAAGGRAFFPKKRDLRELEAVERFKALEAAGGAAAVEKALKRKRVVLQKKDRTRLPPRA